MPTDPTQRQRQQGRRAAQSRGDEPTAGGASHWPPAVTASPRIRVPTAPSASMTSAHRGVLGDAEYTSKATRLRRRGVIRPAGAGARATGQVYPMAMPRSPPTTASDAGGCSAPRTARRRVPRRGQPGQRVRRCRHDAIRRPRRSASSARIYTGPFAQTHAAGDDGPPSPPAWRPPKPRAAGLACRPISARNLGRLARAIPFLDEVSIAACSAGPVSRSRRDRCAYLGSCGRLRLPDRSAEGATAAAREAGSPVPRAETAAHRRRFRDADRAT